MTLVEVKELLEAAGQKVVGEKRLPNNLGDQLRVDGGGTVDVYDSGKTAIGGKNKAAIEAILQKTSGQSQSRISSKTAVVPKEVFVVYGHDKQTRTQLEAMLRRWGLEPLILDQLPSEGQTIIEKLVNYTHKVSFGVVLATPDDEGNQIDNPSQKMARARQNVILEMGMLLAKLGRARVAILIKEPSKMERPSDIQGLIYIPFVDNLEKEVAVTLAKEMTKQGFSIPIEKL